MRNHLLRIALLGMVLSGCTCHTTDSTEVGVLIRKVGVLGTQGIQPETYLPGATYFFPSLITDWVTYDVALQNLEMTRANKTNGDRKGDDDIQFKTIDGNDIRVDVTVAWQIDATKTPQLLARVGRSTAEVKEKLVRPTCRSVIRDYLNQLRSEEFYVSDKKSQKADQARDRLREILAPEGVIVSQVIFNTHSFHPEYEKVIREKKLAEQNTEKLKSEAHAALERSKSNLEAARGRVSQQLATARGELDTVKLQADAQFFTAEQRAKALVIEKSASAQARRKENEALAGTGGKTLVKLRIAQALKGKRLIFVPSGGKSGATVQSLDLNALLGAWAGKKAAPAPAAKSSSDAADP